MKKESIEEAINTLFAEQFFASFRKYIVQREKARYIKTAEYRSATNKRSLLDKQYKKWFDSISTFYLSLKSIYALEPLVEREIKIRAFSSSKIFRVKADYLYNGTEFSAYYPTHYSDSMQREIDDCINDLKNPKLRHICETYVIKTDTEKSPKEPLSSSQLKFSAFYLFGFSPDYVTALAEKLYQHNIITNPETIGWHINDDFVDEMISLLVRTYGSEKVLEYKRVYKDKIVDRDAQECIRPQHLLENFFPKKLSNTPLFKKIPFATAKERDDALRLYGFIFYCTLATQMKNSIYDTSAIEISVGNKLLKEQANVIIEGEENWELLTGSYIKKISSSENTSHYGDTTVVLPKVPPETVLKPLDVYCYSYPSKRPPRYGVGRFITQILEKNGLGVNKEQDAIVNELINSKAIKVIKTMLHPQENAIILITWLKEHMPLILDMEYRRELDEKIMMVQQQKITLASLLKELERLIEDAFLHSGFEHNDTVPSAAKIGLAKRVASKYGVTLDASITKSSAKLDIFLAAHPLEEPTKIGSCPECNALVFQYEHINLDTTGEIYYAFSCENFGRYGQCTFSLWDSYVYQYFSDKAVEFHDVSERADALKKILSKKKGYLFNGFRDKNNQPYEAKVRTNSYEDPKTNRQRWGLTLDFPKRKRRA